MKACFIASGGIETASARMRAWWVAPHMGADVVTIQDLQAGKTLPDADWYIWQKVASIEVMAGLLDRGKSQAWDICEPSWWWQPKQCREIASYSTIVVSSNLELSNDFESWYGLPSATIPDRLDLGHFGPMRKHLHRRGEPIRFIWYGYSQNRHALFSAIAYLERLVCNGIEIALTVMDDKPGVSLGDFEFPIYHTLWRYDREVDIIASHDIAVLPDYPGPWGKVKSNNRQVTAWACNVPTVSGDDWGELWQLATLTDYRARVAESGYEWVKREYQAHKSAIEWQRLLS